MGVQFVNPSSAVSEGVGSAQLVIVRTEDGGKPVTVDMLCTDLTAKAGLDYVETSNQVTFSSMEIAKTVAIPILNNSVKDGARTFMVTLANAVGTSLGQQTSTTVTIQDDDLGFRFDAGSVSMAEDAGAARIVVWRGSDDTNSVVTVDVYTLEQTAVAGSDYMAITNTLIFAPGETCKVLAVPVLNDGIKEPSKTFRVCLANPSAGMELASPSTITVTIVDNDPQLGFDQGAYTSPWGASEIALTVVRGNDANLGSITVDYTTTDLSARNGTDYLGSPGTLRFDSNETIKTLRIPILVNRPTGRAKYFRVTLKNPSGGAELGTATARVSLEGAFFTLGPQYDPKLAIYRDAGFNLVTWLGGGEIQRADYPSGPWSSLGPVQSYHPVSATMPGSFYRIKNPRPASVYVPATYDAHTPMPLVIALHGYTSNGAGIDGYFNLTSYAASRGFLYCYPDGLVLRSGGRDWNCWFEDPAVAAAYSIPWSDDVGFIRGIIEAVGEQFNLDRKRVYLVGHSQGGGMSHFAALHCADLIAGIVSFAGDPAVFYPPPSEPVNILHIHGTADETVGYHDSLPTSPPYTPSWPGALRIAQVWADLNGATGRVTDPVPTLDLETSLPGLDTVITRWTNAPPGGAVELWTIVGALHVPSLSASFTPEILDWLLAHPKP
jgi:polyhydroxybutyrate depolymerase